MRIGFCSIYAWRPHVEHLHYLADLIREANHHVSFLTCDGDLDACYTKELRPGRLDMVNCLTCRAGGLRSYERDNVHNIGSLHHEGEMPPAAAEWSSSSASTLGRFETDADFASEEFLQLAARLRPPTLRAYHAALSWIEQEKLDAVFVFNGRMDATRGVLEASRTAGIPVVSVERTWFGDGLQLLPGENCLGLRNVDSMMVDWREKPLTRQQALRAAGHVAARFLQQNTKEWRAYNLSAVKSDWPVTASKKRVLLVPGSRNEVYGHPDWHSAWPEHTAAFDAVMKHFNLSSDDVVLRCHPNWGERIGRADGSKAENYYTEWAKRAGVHWISSTDPTSTLCLIEAADAVVVCGGSAALEAGILGKQVIAVAPSVYRCAGFQTDAASPAALQQQQLQVTLDKDVMQRRAAEIARKTLRFAYTMIYRMPQYVDYVRCMTTTRYEYREGADPQRLIDLLSTGELQADDAVYATGEAEEDGVLASVADRDWQGLIDDVPDPIYAPRRFVKRRMMFRPLDALREAMPRGDR
jgi:hypothetical protein